MLHRSGVTCPILDISSAATYGQCHKHFYKDCSETLGRFTAMERDFTLVKLSSFMEITNEIMADKTDT